VNTQIARRRFLKLLGIGAGGAGAAGVLKVTASTPAQALPVSAHGVARFMQSTEDPAAMDAAHEKGVKAFLDNVGKDTNFWRSAMPFKMDGDTKVFEVVAQDIEWETDPMTKYPAMAYNGLVPGPEIRVTEGDKVRINFKNEMKQSTAIHFHGVRVPNAQDGVPYVTEQPVKSGESKVYEFVAKNPGSHMYHSHHNAAEQVTAGLFGAFIIEAKDKSREPQVSAEYIMTLNDTTLGFTLNGKSFPYTQPVVAKLGDKIRIRYMNEGLIIHPMHLHGIPQLVFAKDGYNLPAPYMVDTLNIAPGERYDVLIDCDEAGVWAFHCHILTHAESRDGMFGMVTVLIVNK
jgi:FtsP/CotA-like multicopper oxidase with cupredoxin domain